MLIEAVDKAGQKNYIESHEGALKMLPVDVCNNTSLVDDEEIVWDGTKLTDSVIVPIGTGRPVLIKVINSSDKELTVSIEHKVAANQWLPYVGADGNPLSWTVAATTGAGVYGPIQCWPRYVSGRIVLSAADAPAADSATLVQVQEA